MRNRAELKAEWLRYSGLDYSVEDRWLRDKIAILFDIEKPNEVELEVQRMAELRLTLADLPARAYADHEQKLRLLAYKLFSYPAKDYGP